MVFTWCALGYDAVLGNKADCHDKRRVSLWACCFCTLHVQKGLMLCVTLQDSWEGCFSGVLNWKRAPLMRRAGLTDRGVETLCRALFFFFLRWATCDERCLWSCTSLSTKWSLWPLIPPKKKCTFTSFSFLMLLQLASCSAAVPALGLAICWRSGELCHLEPQTANSCSLDRRCRLRDNVKLIF